MKGFVLSFMIDFFFLNFIMYIQATTGTNFHLLHGPNPSNGFLVIKGKAKL